MMCHKKSKFLFFTPELAVVLCFCLGLFTGCSSVGSFDSSGVNGKNFEELEPSSFIPDCSPEELSWQKINSFAEYFSFENAEIPLRWHLVKISLDSPKVKIVAFPSKKTELNRGITGKKFAKDSGCFVSVNTTPFEGKFLSSRKIVGIHKVQNVVFSWPVPRYAALVLKTRPDGSLKAFVCNQGEEERLQEGDFAFGGFFTILKHGEPVEFSYSSRNSRSAAGVSSDGKTLFLLAVEGEKLGKSRGLSYGECARIMLFAGAADSLQFDGGGSVSLFIEEKNVLSCRNFRKCGAFFGLVMED